MSNLIIEKLLSKSKRTDLPQFGPGDTIRVQVKIKEGDKERLQAFEGVVIARSRGPQASFTVRKISFGQGVEDRKSTRLNSSHTVISYAVFCLKKKTRKKRYKKKK